MLLQEEVVIVTGSTTGIGRAIAERCVQEGARVVIHGLEPDSGRVVAQELGAAAMLFVADFTDPTAPSRLVKATIAEFGQLDAVVNNAAWIARSSLETTSPELFDRMIAVNLRAPLLLIQAALPHLAEANGSVLNIGSINGYCGEADLLAYSVAKGGLMTLSRNLGDTLHLQHGVRVNHLNLGWVLSENEYQRKIDDGLPEQWPQQLPEYYAPSGRLIEPEEVAEAAIYWVSEASQPISGSVVDLEQYPVIGRNPNKA